MSNYIKVLTQFIQLGYQQNELLNEKTHNFVLDNLSFSSIQNEKFDPRLAIQLWEHAQLTFQQYLRTQMQKYSNNSLMGKQNTDKVPVFIICETICKAHNILMNQIDQLKRSLQNNQLDDKDKQKKLVQLYSAYEQHKHLSCAFKIKPIQINDTIKQAIELVQRAIRPQVNIFSLNPIFDGSDLQISFRLAVFMLAIELILLLQKPHFYNLMSALMVLAIFGLNYFDRYYIRVLLITLGITSMIDMVWIINKFKFYLYPKSPTLYSKLHDQFLKLIVFGVFLLIVFKFVQIALLFKYRNISSNNIIVVDFSWMRITLDTKVGKNPLSRLILQTFGQQ